MNSAAHKEHDEGMPHAEDRWCHPDGHCSHSQQREDPIHLSRADAKSQDSEAENQQQYHVYSQ